MKPEPTYTARQRDAAAREAIEMTVRWDDVEIVDGTVTGRLVIRPVK